MNTIRLVTLAAIWGASFLFMRMGAPHFGAVPLIALRVAIAAVLLAPVLRDAGARREFRAHWWPLAVVGVTNSALPFCLLTFAALSLTAGVDAVLNATTPLWAAIVALLWLRTPITRLQAAGLATGFAGVLLLAGSELGHGGTLPAVLAALAATLSYGFAAHYAKRRLADVRPFVSAFGSQCFAALVLAPIAAFSWPAGPLAPLDWVSVALLGAVCTALAYLLYFRLLQDAGAQYAASVTFLIPVFGLVWGAMFLHEPITLQAVAGCAVILLGTALTTGRLRGRSGWVARR